MELCYQSPRGAEGEGRVKAAKAVAGGWERDIGCGTCNNSSIKKDGSRRVILRKGSWETSAALYEDFPPMIFLAT